jgi:hypothetical protein
MRGCDKECDMRDQIGRNDQTRTRATETLIKQTERRHTGSIHRSSSSSPREWLLKYRGKIFPISRHLCPRFLTFISL